MPWRHKAGRYDERRGAGARNVGLDVFPAVRRQRRRATTYSHPGIRMFTADNYLVIFKFCDEKATDLAIDNVNIGR